MINTIVNFAQSIAIILLGIAMIRHEKRKH